MENILELYTDYLISSNGQTTATGLSEMLDNAIGHDKITRFLAHSNYDSKSLWQQVKSLVRTHESEDACLVFDDTVVEKAYTDENPLICWHWDHSKGRNVKGINLLSAFYVTQKDENTEAIRVPVSYETILKTVVFSIIKTKKLTRQSPITKNELMQQMITQCIHNQLKFKYILADSWFASADNMKFIQDKKKFFIFDIKDNRLACLGDLKPDKKSDWANIKSLKIPDNTPVKVWLKDLDFPVLITKQVFKNEDGSVQGVRFLVSNDWSLTHEQFATIYKKRWGVEEYHKSLKQNVSIAKSPTRTVKTQSNHLYSSIWAYVKLEKLKFATKINQFQLKSKIYIKALKAAFQELAALNKTAQSMSA
jgi:DDE superfamily endonuclease